MAVYTAIDFGNAGGMVFNDVSVNTLMVANNGYDVLVNSVLTMPAISARDDTIRVTNFSAAGFTIQCNPGEVIYGLNTQTSAGGTIVATTQGSSLLIVCLTALTEWQILSAVGTLQFN